MIANRTTSQCVATAKTFCTVSFVCLMLLESGCQSKTTDMPDAKVELIMKPADPVVGTNELLIRLADADGEPLEGAVVRVEGNMNHAGMKPSFSNLTEMESGEYTGTLEFTMGGDWFLLVTAVTNDGNMVERKIDVPGVQVK